MSSWGSKPTFGFEDDMISAVFLVASQVMYHLLQLTIRKQRSCSGVEERLHLASPLTRICLVVLTESEDS